MADEQPLERRILVRATQVGFYGGNRVRVGRTFTVLEREFSQKWMELAAPSASDDLAAARAASPKQRGAGGVELKQKPKEPPPGGRHGLAPDDGI
jgi:hypothetical protein